jgi:DNA modification methylase
MLIQAFRFYGGTQVGRAALKLVERAPFFTRELELQSSHREGDAHSLHYAGVLPGAIKPEVPGYLIEQMTEKGGVVLDPFSGSGRTALEAVLRGRIAYASDTNPLAVRISRARLRPADITEVTLQLQFFNPKRPVKLDHYNEFFKPFFDINTFRELSNLRRYLANNEGSRIAEFVELMALSLLHGPSAGYFSSYTFPQVALSPAEQIRLNDRRSQTPDYRAVMPRILRKTAMVLRDGVPSVLARMAAESAVVQSDPRTLAAFASDSVDLVVTAPPLPNLAAVDSGAKKRAAVSGDQWLKLWFARINRAEVEEQSFRFEGLGDWLDFINEVLFELARVVRPGGRAVFDLRKLIVDGQELLLDQEVGALVEEKLSRMWDLEGVLLTQEKNPKLKNSIKGRTPKKGVSKQSRLLILRKR